MLVLLGIVGIFVILGFYWTTRPFPARAAASVCTDRTVPAGTSITPSDVTVSVYNASNREGLAERTLAALTVHHFADGLQQNAPKGTTVNTAQVWAPSKSDPAARLVAAWLPGATIVVHASSLPGVTVVVGQNFTAVSTKGPSSTTAATAATVCSPVVG